jgi:hypothetical protein
VSQATPPAAPQNIDQLLKLGVDAARGGNRQAARALFLALAREHPSDVRVWAALAGVAASRNEQREALERIVALDPANERAHAALARLNGGETPAVTLAAPTPAALAGPVAAPADTAAAPAPPAATEPDDEQAAAAPFPLLNAIALGVILLLLAAVGVILGRALLGGASTVSAPATATPALVLVPPAGGEPAAGATAAPPPTAAAQATALPAPTAPAATAAPPPPTAGGQQQATAAPASPQPAPSAAPAPGETLTLPMGAPIDHDGWTAVLVSPDYALPLEGAIGDLQPAGRFVLAVVAVSNNSPTPRVIPPDMFVLVDGAGRTFTPVPGASSAYLALYQRAQRGDLALEDTFDPVVGLRSVPLIFDVPPDAAGLRLTVNGAGPAGWPVGEAPPPTSPSGP